MNSLIILIKWKKNVKCIQKWRSFTSKIISHHQNQAVKNMNIKKAQKTKISKRIIQMKRK